MATERPKGTARRDALLDSAERAARAHGFDGFSYADLAAEVGIRTASIHYHFPTKAALGDALMARYHEAFAETLAGIEAGGGTGAGRLRALMDRYRAAHGDARQVCLCAAFTIGRDGLPPSVVKRMISFRAAVRDWIGAAFALGGEDGTVADVRDPAAEAAALLALLEGAQLAARAASDPGAFDRAVALAAARLAE